jgi:RNA polymerase sigma-70 factor, ECF subfamily
MLTDAVVSDRELAARMLAGEEDAFERFFDDYFPRLYRFALARTGQDAQAAEDIVQSTLIRAISGLRGYRGEAALFTWLCTICRREIGAFHERRGRQGSVPLIEDAPEVRAALDSLAAALAGDPETQVHRNEVSRLVQATLDCLPHAHALALEWKYIHGRSVQEIAEHLKLGLKAAESLLTRARQSFRDGFAAVAREGWQVGLRPARPERQEGR